MMQPPLEEPKIPSSGSQVLQGQTPQNQSQAGKGGLASPTRDTPHSPSPSRHTGLGRYLETPPDLLLSLGNSLTHRGTLAGEGTSSAGPGFVNPALLFCLNYPFQGPKAGGLPLGPRGLAEVLDGPCGFVSVPALGSGRAKGTHTGVSPGTGFGGPSFALSNTNLAQHGCQHRGSSPQEFSWLFPAVAVGVGVLGSSCPAQITLSSALTEARGSPQCFIPSVPGAAVVPEQPGLLGLSIGIVLALLVRSGFPALEMGGPCSDPTSGSQPSQQMGSTCLMEHFGN